MKSFLTILLSCLCFSLSAQSSDTSLEDRVRYLQQDLRTMKVREVAAGRQLRDYSTTFYTGFALQVVGSFLIITEASRSSSGNTPASGFYYAGLTLGVAGSICQLLSHGKIGAAGNILSGVRFPYKSKRRVKPYASVAP